jgi:hypothetical protein
MNWQLVKEALGWGIVLWLIGYVLGVALFAFVPVAVIGWILMPVGIVITLFVLLKRIKGTSFLHYAVLAVVWTMLAVVLDYLLLVKLFKPADGYYKLDVYLYYAFTFFLPLIVGWRKGRKAS